MRTHYCYDVSTYGRFCDRRVVEVKTLTKRKLDKTVVKTFLTFDMALSFQQIARL